MEDFILLWSPLQPLLLTSTLGGALGTGFHELRIVRDPVWLTKGPSLLSFPDLVLFRLSREMTRQGSGLFLNLNSGHLFCLAIMPLCWDI